MSIKDGYVAAMKAAFERTAYGKWVKDEGVEVYEDFAVEDVREVDLAPWARLGGKAVFLNLYPLMEAARGMYVAEIPPGEALEPEHHLYEKVIFILEGHGTTEVWQEGDAGKHVFEWGRGTVFAPPLNVWHRMYNVGREPVKFLAITDAPAMLNGFRDIDFIFHCPYPFRSRYAGEDTYFTPSQKRYLPSSVRSATTIWETNLIHNAFDADLDPDLAKTHGGFLTMFEMSGNSLIGHISEWPVGRYHKAHYHGPGALLMGLRSEGYVLLWPKELGTRPYESGHGDEVLQVPWRAGSLYTPPSDWFHQHFNTGKEPARHIAVRHGSRLAGPGFGYLGRQHGDLSWNPNLTSVNEGGTLINYEDEDPEVRRQYREALTRNGVDSQMSDEIYRAGTAKTWSASRGN